MKTRKEKLKAIGKINFPVKAKFIDEKVLILGPVCLFEPYKDTKKDNNQLICQYLNGKRFITFASMLYVKGKRLMTPAKIKGKGPFVDLLERLAKN